MKKVWASAWKLTAYDARADAGIDQSQVQAGALIQTAVAATAAGVLVTRHPTDPTDARHYTINAKHGLGLAVVDGKKIPESLIVNWYNHGIASSAVPTKRRASSTIHAAARVSFRTRTRERRC